jgi:hypothetical protein
MSEPAQITDPGRQPQFDTKFDDAEYERFLVWFQTSSKSHKERKPQQLAAKNPDKPDSD